MKIRIPMMIIGLLCAGIAQAQQPTTETPRPASPDVRVAELPAETPLSDYRCLRYTGSLITASRNQRNELRRSKTQEKPLCAPVAGRAWSREDLERTGAVNLHDALRMLDPAVH